MSEPTDFRTFLADRLDKHHQHHRHCVHNLSVEEQRAGWLRRCDGDQEQYDIIYGNAEPVVITPAEWEIDVPDIDWGPLEEGNDE